MVMMNLGYGAPNHREGVGEKNANGKRGEKATANIKTIIIV